MNVKLMAYIGSPSLRRERRPFWLFYSGYTLSEVIMVMVILGILSAYVVMRFNGLDGGARAVAVKTLAGRIRVAADTVYNLSVAEGAEDMSGHIIKIRGKNAVQTSYGYPTPTEQGIVAAVADNSSNMDMDNVRVEVLSGASDVIAFVRSDAREPDRCRVIYTYYNQAQPSVDVDVSGCK